MRRANGSQIADLIGIYILLEITDQFPDTKCDLYNDDALRCLQNISKRRLRKFKNGLEKFFHRTGFSIIFDDEMTKTNFLDIIFNLYSDSYSPSHRLSSNLRYINSSSNHAKSVMDNLVRNFQGYPLV